MPSSDDYKDTLCRFETRLRRASVVFPRLVDEINTVLLKSGAWEMKEPIFEDLRAMAEIVDGNKADTVEMLSSFKQHYDDLAERIGKLIE